MNYGSTIYNLSNNRMSEEQQEIISLAKELDVPEQVQTSGATPANLPLQKTIKPSNPSHIQQRMLTDLISQKRQWSVVQITTSMAAMAHIQTIDFSYDFLANWVLQYSSSLAFYRGISADVRVTVEISSNIQHQGALIGIYANVPSAIYNALPGVTSKQTIARFPRKFMTFGHDGSYQFELPWQSNLQYFPFQSYYNEKQSSDTGTAHNQYNSNGRLVFRVFDPLRAVENANTPLTARFWVELVNTKLYVYNPTANNYG